VVPVTSEKAVTQTIVRTSEMIFMATIIPDPAEIFLAPEGIAITFRKLLS